MSISPITTKEFECFQHLIYDHAGISLSAEKKVMVASRLAKRLDHHGLSRYGDYFQIVLSQEYPDEFQMMVDILTTNETYFFREPQHFEFFHDEILRHWRDDDNFRVWSAASSSGEEAYSLAMVMAESLGMRSWEVFGSDVSVRVLNSARAGVYSMDRLQNMDNRYLEKYCLKGVRAQQGFFRVDAKIRSHVEFEQVNLKAPLPPHLGKFNVIFLRNVLIYFDQETKQHVVESLLRTLKSGGYFFVSHSESLHLVTDKLQMVKPSIYRKP
ncbi:MAG: protein-glutamate O-methyltransferase CheR [Methylomonas sp.]|nr:protein-glutamate O-methyltransferase CheR [Methylomonas sp.]